MGDRVFVKDLEGRFVLDNIAHREYLQLAETEDVEGKTVEELFPEDLAAMYGASDRAVIESGEPMMNREEPALPPRGSKFAWILTTKVPLRDTDGNIVGLVGVSRDITERKLAEEKLRLFADQLERSNQELQDFASVASHDLQEPLRKIRAFGDRLKAKCGDALGETGRDYLERMQDAASRMQTLINDLLTLARVTSRAQPFVQVDLAEIIWDVISDLYERIRQTGARIEVGSLPVIEADPLQMRQLFQNLISNALKFQHPGREPMIGVAGKIFDSVDPESPSAVDGEKVCKIIVQDNGIGFDEKYADRIFAVFQRLHAKHEYAGTGIGLAVCRKIVDRHGGSIVAKSAEGHGATFVVTLPVKQSMNEPNEQLR
jgi:PAS domain S-box-containing protein